MKSFLVLLALGVLAALFITFLVSFDFYPILTVDGAAVSARRFWKNYRAAVLYRENVAKTYNLEQLPGDGNSRELEAGILSQLVEAELVAAGAKREAGGDLEYLLAAKLSRYDENSELKGAVASLYGMSYADFRAEVLMPQAEQDILAGRLYLRGQSLSDWLVQAKQEAQVVVLSRDFRWDGKEIVPN